MAQNELAARGRGEEAEKKFKELKKAGEAVRVDVRNGSVRIRDLTSSRVRIDERTVSVVELYADSDVDCHFKIYGLPESDDPLGHIAQIISEHGAKVTEERR